MRSNFTREKSQLGSNCKQGLAAERRKRRRKIDERRHRSCSRTLMNRLPKDTGKSRVGREQPTANTVGLGSQKPSNYTLRIPAIYAMQHPFCTSGYAGCMQAQEKIRCYHNGQTSKSPYGSGPDEADTSHVTQAGGTRLTDMPRYTACEAGLILRTLSTWHPAFFRGVRQLLRENTMKLLPSFPRCVPWTA